MSDDPLTRLRAAVAHHQAGRLTEAEPLYADLVADIPGFADALHLYGVLCAQTGRNARALELIGNAIARNGNAAAYHANFARALRAEGRLPEAADSLRRAIALQPAADAFFSLGNVLKQAGQTAEATERYRDALALKPDFVDARINAAAALDALDRRNEALAHLRLALATAPANPTVLYNLARTEQAFGAPDRAVAGYRRALRADPGFEGAAANLGAALLDAHRPAAALTVLRRLVAAAPDRPDRLLPLATALADAGATDAALAAFRRLMALTPQDPTPWQRSAEALEAAGRPGEAAAILVEVGRLGRCGRFHWKTAYYHLVRLCNTRLAEGRPDRVAALLSAVIAAWRGVDGELQAWALFLQGSLAVLRDDGDRARDAFAAARPYLPFLVHVPVGDAFARRVEALPAAAVAESEAAFVAESIVQPGSGPVVIAACDAGYLRRFAPLYLSALERFAAAGQVVHLHVVDPAPDTPAVMAALAAGRHRCRPGWSHEAAPAGLSAEARTTYYTFARFLRLGELAARYRTPLLVTDIDACILSDPAAFTAPLTEDRPLALQHFPGNLARLYDGIGGGLVALRPEPPVLALFDRIRRFLLSWTAERTLSYFLDQVALVAGLDDATRRGVAPGILPVRAEGRLFLCGEGRFVQILDEKNRPGFDGTVRRLVDDLVTAGPPVEPHAERERILRALGTAG
ncbi:tetratricopeptide repeat protein [Azospirillum halopraeferens]|uniref:tetratricopeptide repeat protein n=1 Tax=Azospirillum halopraeferens TaxID=34010 RepID=UPI000420BD88|nr:tetratricopeptide repeat protein [Azospirillum halopraeferens]